MIRLWLTVGGDVGQGWKAEIVSNAIIRRNNRKDCITSLSFYFWNCTGVDNHFLIKEDIIIYLTQMRQIDHEKIITQYILLKSTPKYLDEQATRKCPVSIYDDAELVMIGSDG